MRWSFCAAILLSACYAPALPGGAPCKLTTNSCPNGQSCVAMGTGSDGVCMADHGRIVDAGMDSTPVGDAGETCVGGHLLGSVCLSAVPTGPITLTTAGPVNSGSVAAGGCTEIHPQAGGPALCVIAGTTIDIPAGVTIRAFAVSQGGAAGTGTNPLVLIATDSITVEGTIDVASHVHDTLAGGIPVLGAGARTAVGCAATGLDGTQGKPDGMNDSFGGGGAAGGSFGSLGGAGGSGGNSSNVAHGNPVLGTIPNLLAGGCPGGNGGNGDGGLGGGAGGYGGGAVYLLAGKSITIAGKINASGSGGVEGGPGMFSSGGGGGGGSGGMIGLEAQTITITASAALYANGGGGASGSGGQSSDTAKPGSDPIVPTTTGAPGGAGSDGGGAGGAGSSAAAAGSSGQNGNPNGGKPPECAGGGGGGGAGVIRIFSAQPAMTTGSISPPAH